MISAAAPADPGDGVCVQLPAIDDHLHEFRAPPARDKADISAKQRPRGSRGRNCAQYLGRRSQRTNDRLLSVDGARVPTTATSAGVRSMELRLLIAWRSSAQTIRLQPTSFHKLRVVFVLDSAKPTQPFFESSVEAARREAVRVEEQVQSTEGW
jgi:hypothetical protein